MAALPDCPCQVMRAWGGGRGTLHAPPLRLTHHEAGAFQPDQQRILWGSKLNQWGRMGGRRVAGQELLASHLAVGLTPYCCFQLCQPLLQLRNLGEDEEGEVAGCLILESETVSSLSPCSPWRSGQTGPALASSTAQR